MPNPLINIRVNLAQLAADATRKVKKTNKLGQDDLEVIQTLIAGMSVQLNLVKLEFDKLHLDAPECRHE